MNISDKFKFLCGLVLMAVVPPLFILSCTAYFILSVSEYVPKALK